MDAPYYQCFKKGFKVEVCFNDVGFRGSWYSATILENPTKKTEKFLLEFDTLLDDGRSKKPLKEHVNFLLVRPVPPRETNRSFQLNEDVDAYHHDGWWEGVVTKVLPGSNGEPTKYSVFFRSSREQLEFLASDLRLHREWVYGNWDPPLEDDSAAASSELEPHQSTQGGSSSPEASSTSSPVQSK